MDVLSLLVNMANRYVANDVADSVLRSELVVFASDASDAELKALAHLISEYAIHLRSPH